MAFSVTTSHLYTHGAPENYFDGVDAGVLTAKVGAARGECSRMLSPRAGGPLASWTFTDPDGEEECRRDIITVAAADIALHCGLTLPGEGADPQWVARAAEVRKLWSRMGTVGVRDAEPLYAGLADATADVTEGAARGWYTPFESQEVEA
ncbi:MAG: hypothetical protein EKK62_03145 [Acidimicrobiia bacterium]|nr:MAG: hypothetical protein EKK62_03145 [Acidimicrobiia bacterium]